MILRVTRGRADYRVLQGIAASLQDALPSAPVGLAQVHLAQRRGTVETSSARDGTEALVISLWESAESVASADARGASPLAIAGHQLEDLRVEHFEVDAVVRRESDRPTHLIRIATGRFSKPGAHTEMLETLRQRAPLIGEPMLAAYTGRRMTGREVCVTFVSTWHEAPPGQDLEKALWPDIALRYDSFEVSVYETIRPGGHDDPPGRAAQ